MIRFTGDVLGVTQLDRALTRLSARASSLTVPFEKVGEDLRDQLKERFDAEGFGWQKLSTRYAARKAKQYPGKTILRRTDRMYTSLVRKNAPGNVSRVRPMEAEFGTTVPYARHHQTGTTIMPAREIFRLREQDKRQITKTLHTYLMMQAQEIGFEARAA